MERLKPSDYLALIQIVLMIVQIALMIAAM